MLGSLKYGKITNIKMSLLLNLGDKFILEVLVIIHFENTCLPYEALQITAYEALLLPLVFMALKFAFLL